MEVLKFIAGVITLIMFFVEAKNKKGNTRLGRKKILIGLVIICLALTPILIFTNFAILTYLYILWFIASLVWLGQFLYSKYLLNSVID